VSDPSWSDATRDDLHTDLGLGLGLGGMCLALEFLLHPQANQCLVDILDDEARSVINTWRITACEPGVDTDDDGFIYCRLEDEDPGAGQAKIYFYRGSARDNTAGNELVATAAGNNSSTLTITAETGYSLAGTVDIEAVGAGNDAHPFTIHVQVPIALRASYNFDGSSADDEQIKTELLARAAAMRGFIAQARVEAQEFCAFLMRTKFRTALITGSGSVSGDNLLVTTRNNNDGAIEETYSGLLEDLRRAQAANTGGSAEIKAGSATLSGSVTFPGWQGTASGPTYGQRGVAAQITWRCIKKLTSTPPQFQAVRTTTDKRRRPGEGTQSEEMIGRPLTIGSEWSAKEWGINALTVNYKAALSSVTNNLLSTTAGDWTVAELTNSNSSEGVFYPHYDGSTLRFYKTVAGRTAQDTSDVAASATVANTAINSTFQATGSTGLTINGKTGNGNGTNLVTGSTATLDFQAPTVTGNSLFRLTIAEADDGSEWQKRMRDLGVGGINYYVNNGASPNLKDAWIKRCLPLINAGVSGARY
jgi:hypothetical protein